MNPFLEALPELEYGSLAPRLGEDLAKLVAEVTATRKAGSITLKLKIKPAGDRGQVEIISDVDLKLPKPEPGKSLFFGTDKGQLLRHDPRQQKLPGFEDEDGPIPIKRAQQTAAGQ
jgi:hypothetical protein